MNHIGSMDAFHAATRDWARPQLSVVIPMFNEVGNAEFVVRDAADALSAVPHEIIVVDDGSQDGTLSALRALKEEAEHLRILRQAENVGQSRAILTGVMAARADVIVTLDGDGQNPAADILALHEHLLRDSAPEALAMVGGYRQRRQDKRSRLIGSALAGFVRRHVLNDSFADTGCGIKIFKKKAFLQLPFFDHQHRYLPLLMRREGFCVDAFPVSHRPRLTGRSKYTNLGRAAVAIRDILGVLWLRDRAKRPSSIEEI